MAQDQDQDARAQAKTGAFVTAAEKLAHLHRRDPGAYAAFMQRLDAAMAA